MAPGSRGVNVPAMSETSSAQEDEAGLDDALRRLGLLDSQANEELRIADVLGDGGRLPAPETFPWGKKS